MLVNRYSLLAVPDNAPRARVPSYSYATASVELFASRFVSFHYYNAYKVLISLSQALVYAHEDGKSYGQVLRSTIGVVFLATPHRGSDTANLANVIANIVNTCQAITTAGLRPAAARTELLEYLTRTSSALQSLLVSVRHRLQNLSIVTFYESRVTPPLSCLVSKRARFNIYVQPPCRIPNASSAGCRSRICRAWHSQ